MDLLWLDHIPVLLNVDMQTRSQDAVCIEDGKSADKLWEAFVEARWSVYTGYLDRFHLEKESSWTVMSSCKNVGLNALMFPFRQIVTQLNWLS